MKNLELVKRIKEIIEKELYLEKNSDGTYNAEIYVDRDDMYIEDKGILAELSENGEDAVYDYISDCYLNSEISEKDYTLDVIKSKFTDEELEEYEDEIYDFVTDNISFNFPKGFVWDSEVLVNITITGYNDYDYDFSHNTFYKDDNGYRRLCNGAIKWLIEQQGYNVNDFEKELNIENIPFTNNFFSSVYNEMINTTTSLNALVLSTKMTLKELIDLKKSHSNNNFKTLKVGKNCDIGLVDFWQGAGSVLEIKLEKDLEIPLENIYEVCCDSSYRYGIADIYGLSSSTYWNEVNYTAI